MRIEINNFKQKSLEELDEEILNLKNDLLHVKQKKASSTVEPNEIRDARKNLATALRVRTEKHYEKLVEEYKGTPVHKLPKMLRPKKTRAQRLALTRGQKRRVVPKVRARRMAFKKVCFAFNE